MARKYTEARKENNRKWDAENLDRMSIALPKGKKDEIRIDAESAGISVNKYIGDAIEARLSAGNNVLLDLSQADGFSLSQIEHAAEQAGLSVNGWIMEAIKQAL